jgi:hypothetical protein
MKLAVKFLATYGAVFAVSLFYVDVATSFWLALIATLVIGTIGYFGDLMIMPRIGNVSAVALDALTVFVVMWAVQAIFLPNGNVSFSWALITALLIGAFEWVYHRYLMEKTLPTDPSI